MNDERATRQGFLSRIFNDPNDDDRTSVYSPEEVGTSGAGGTTGVQEARGFTVERAAEIIRNLPPEVPQGAAVRIVRNTLEAAGINVAELATSTRARESKLGSEIELSQGRIRELKEKTDEVVRSLEDEIRKARQARDFGISEEERRIEAAESGLEDVGMVRDFFGLPEAGEEPRASAPETASSAAAPGDRTEEDPEAAGGETDDGEETGDETQVIEDVEEDDTQVLRRPGPLSDDYWDGRESRDR